MYRNIKILGGLPVQKCINPWWVTCTDMYKILGGLPVQKCINPGWVTCTEMYKSWVGYLYRNV